MEQEAAKQIINEWMSGRRHSDENLGRGDMSERELQAWIASRGVTQSMAAWMLALTTEGLRKNLYGQRRIGAQTIRIIELLEGKKIEP